MKGSTTYLSRPSSTLYRLCDVPAPPFFRSPVQWRKPESRLHVPVALHPKVVPRELVKGVGIPVLVLEAHLAPLRRAHLAPLLHRLLVQHRPSQPEFRGLKDVESRPGPKGDIHLAPPRAILLDISLDPLNRCLPGVSMHLHPPVELRRLAVAAVVPDEPLVLARVEEHIHAVVLLGAHGALARHRNRVPNPLAGVVRQLPAQRW
eukprot:CAMPEP_0114109740 /NCGR_PEP_ID=MMETSP0043_2-20121206/936_1 /TAXON_ID=464988 /ORGANISM="Hemiselmis andersenii, Strain CCMP644" /LENGTH=204 /DNA_ID=CAMNT_0001201635 /DNA_START=425 /DNA_END=1036 /DNA_ORIENTATION=-